MRIEKLKLAIVWCLPRWVIYWATIRLMAYVTTEVYTNKQPDEIAPMDYLKAWER